MIRKMERERERERTKRGKRDISGGEGEKGKRGKKREMGREGDRQKIGLHLERFDPSQRMIDPELDGSTLVKTLFPYTTLFRSLKNVTLMPPTGTSIDPSNSGSIMRREGSNLSRCKPFLKFCTQK